MTNKRKQTIYGASVAIILTIATFYLTDFKAITVATTNAYDSVSAEVGGYMPTTVQTEFTPEPDGAVKGDKSWIH